jgi:hypothetical protein
MIAKLLSLSGVILKTISGNPFVEEVSPWEHKSEK